MSEELNKLEQLFNVALELASPKERADFLAHACGADVDVRKRVEKLLRAHETAGQFLSTETPVQASLPLSELDFRPTEKPGDQIDRYTLVEEIGEGGCCVVYLADQREPVRRPVALKLIKAGMDTRQVVARFEVERQALALMDHPHIAKVFDAGVTAAGRPYFVMELVRGIPLTKYCDEHSLTVKQRLELFMQVAHAVQHAHQKGIIHRDLKPSNILVASGDPPAPKIIDFGIAKATQMPLTDRAVVTWVGQFVGTPAYMSPEQAQMNSEDIDARADIYSLGALLYELLTGVTPFDQETLATTTFDEIRQMIQETEPLKPSARLLATNRSQKSEVRSQNWKEVRGDLDWIVMKALEKDRQRRYATAHEFAEDIQRHLKHEPVLAGPPSAAYRARKFVRRHRVGVAVAAVVTLALVAGLSLALVGLQRALRAEAATSRERDRALQAEAQMRRERDRALQAEADTRGILSLFDESLGVDEDRLDLHYATARLARERLDPTNPAAISFILPLGHNLGRIGAWTNALEVYLWLNEAASWNCNWWTHAHAAALAAGQTNVSRRLRTEIAKRFGDTQDSITAMQVGRAVLIESDCQEHLQTGVECARRAYQAVSHDSWFQLVQGMAEYRRGQWSEASKVLQEPEHAADACAGAIAGCFRAMARHQAGETNTAREILRHASRQMQFVLHRGLLPSNGWHYAVFGLVARAEAERLLLGKELSPPVTAESLVEARKGWRAVREHLGRGDALAREKQWTKSRDAYAAALRDASFDWAVAEDEGSWNCLSLQMGIAFARAGDTANHTRLCRLLLSLAPDMPMTAKMERDATVMSERYAKTCFLQPRGLPPELCQRALEIARFAVTNQLKRNDHHPRWTCHTGGIAEYYAGQPERALELLLDAERDDDPVLRGSAMVYRAMVLQKLNRSAEAVEALQKAEDLFKSSPEANSGLYWWGSELYKLALEEARQLIHGRGPTTDR